MLIVITILCACYMIQLLILKQLWYSQVQFSQLEKTNQYCKKSIVNGKNVWATDLDTIANITALLQNPDIVLVHYLNVPYPDDNKLVMASSISLWADKKEWTKEELISQLKPMCQYLSSHNCDSHSSV